MYKVTIDLTKCEGDGDCVDTCPTEVFALVDIGGEKKAKAVAPEECIGCDSCVAVCPTEAITVEEVG
jgi:NAD-dependent dihydropyrimidine dehydrogenase PreA subunit